MLPPSYVGGPRTKKTYSAALSSDKISTDAITDSGDVVLVNWQAR